jgi:hypothetical protein
MAGEFAFAGPAPLPARLAQPQDAGDVAAVVVSRFLASLVGVFSAAPPATAGRALGDALE